VQRSREVLSKLLPPSTQSSKKTGNADGKYEAESSVCEKRAHSARSIEFGRTLHGRPGGKELQSKFRRVSQDKRR